MADVYDILWAERMDIAVGYVIEGNGDFDLPSSGKVTNWEGMTLEARDGIACDYLPNELGLRMCSKKLRDIVDAHTTDKDILQWLELRVKSHNECMPYFILHFPRPRDVLDVNETTYVAHTDHVIKPVFSETLCEGCNVFTYDGTMGISWFVRENVKKAIQKAGCTGMDFWPIRVV